MAEFLKSLKGKIIIIIAALVLIAVTVLTILLLGGETGYRNIFISKVFGRVMAENNGTEYVAYENMRLADGYALTTGTGSYTRLNLDDDKYMKLEQDSRALFTNVGSANSHVTAITLESGAMTAELVNPLTEAESFVVNTPNAVLAVRGTFFRVEVYYDEDGNAITNVYVYGGTVSCRRIMPDGTVINEEVLVEKGYKACIKMDEIVTIYVEEVIENQLGDDVDPIDVDEISDGDIVDIYNASYHGHSMFLETGELWQEIIDRDININDYYSVYDFGKVPSYTQEEEASSESESDTAEGETTYDAETTANTSETSDGEAAEDTTDLTEGESENVTVSTEEAINPPSEETAAGDYSEGDPNAAPQESSATATTTSKSTATTVPEVTSTTAGTTTRGPIMTVPVITSQTENNSETSGYQSEEDPETTTAATVSEETTEPEETTTAASAAGGTVPATTTPATTTSQSSGTEHEHTWGEYVYNGDAACTKDGTKTAKCTVCGEENTITAVNTALGHEYGDYVYTEEPTCTEDGVKTAKCIRCDAEDSFVVEESALGHEYGEYVFTEEPTCTEDGLMTAQCIRCDAEDTVVAEGSALGHTEEEDIVEPTMTEEGLITVYCGVCGEILSEEAVPKLDPLYTENGSVIITETGYTQGGETVEYTGDYVISQKDSGVLVDDFHLTVESGTHNITVDGWNINIKDLAYAEYGVIHVLGGASVTLDGTESYITGTKSNNTYHTNEHSYLFYNAGELTVNSGTITILNSWNWEHFLLNKGTFVLNNGTISSFDQDSASFYVGIQNEGTIEINGGLMELITASGIINEGSFVVSGGSLEVHGSGKEGLPPGVIANNGNFDISGGLVKIAVLGIQPAGIINYGSFDVSDGSLVISGGGIINNESFSVYGGSMEINCATTGIENNGNLDVSGGSIVIDGGYSAGIVNYGTSYVSGGSLELSNDASGVHNEASFVVVGGSITGTNNEFGIFHGDDVVNSYGDTLTCVIYDSYPGNITATSFSGEKYTYNLSADDAASDGKYYVWLPVDPSMIVINSQNFPDETFRSYIQGKFDNGDWLLTVQEREAVRNIDIGSSAVADLTGIEFFENLEKLICSSCSELTSIDLSSNTALTELFCSSSGITELDLRNNTKLENLNCSFTAISELNLSNNAMLKTLSCTKTGISELDLSGNGELTYLDCSYTEITELDVSGNAALKHLLCNNCHLTFVDVSGKSLSVFEAEGNVFAIPSGATFRISDLPDGFDPSKMTVISGAEYADGAFSNITGDIVYTYDCGVGEAVTFTLEVDSKIEINEVNFPDSIFRDYVSENFDSDSDGWLSKEECEAVIINIDVAGTSSTDNGVTSLKGIEYFTKLIILDCSYNAGLTELDVSKNTALSMLNCDNTGISELDVSKNTALGSLYCNDTGISELDVSKNTALSILDCYNTGITELDVSKNTALSMLYCYNTGISELDVSNNTALTYLYCNDTKITELDVSKNTALKSLYCYNTEITELDVSKNTALTSLYCYNTGITKLDISSNTALTSLDCNNTGITELDISKNTALTSLLCYNTGISELDVSKNTALTGLYCWNCHLAYVDVSNNPLISTFLANGNTYAIPYGTTFDTKKIPGFDPDKVSNVRGAVLESGVFTNITGDISYTYDCGNGKSETFKLVRSSILDVEGINIDESFPDEVFRAYVSKNFDRDGDGFLSEEECEAVKTIDVSGTSSADGGITSLEGIEYFTKLSTLNCKYNEGLGGELDISNNTSLVSLYCNDTGINKLDVSNHTKLFDLDCSNTKITELDVSDKTSLSELRCYDTGITELDVSNSPSLRTLICSDTELTSLDLSNNPNLYWLNCSGTKIASLDLRDHLKLVNLYCSEIPTLTYLNVSNCTELDLLHCAHTGITYLDLSSNLKFEYLYCYNCRLAYLDVWNNDSIKSVAAGENVYPIPYDAEEIGVDDLPEGFDMDKVRYVTGATLKDGVFTDITADTITYNYDTGFGSVRFSLERTLS